MRSINVALVQQSCEEDKEANLDKSIAAIRRAAGMGSGLVVLQDPAHLRAGVAHGGGAAHQVVDQERVQPALAVFGQGM